VKINVRKAKDTEIIAVLLILFSNVEDAIKAAIEKSDFLVTKDVSTSSAQLVT